MPQSRTLPDLAICDLQATVPACNQQRTYDTGRIYARGLTRTALVSLSLRNRSLLPLCDCIQWL